jgi:hypothetical protein
VLRFEVDWRLIPAGYAVVTRRPVGTGWSVGVELESTGLVGKLYKVKDQYAATYRPPFCAVDTVLEAREGKRHRETRVTYDAGARKAVHVERDLLRNVVVKQAEAGTGECGLDVLGALYELRGKDLKAGGSWDIPVSDGKKTVAVRVEGQEWEEVETKAGKFRALRCEAYIFNKVLYERAARMLIWISDDARRLPVQLKIRMALTIGTVTLQLVSQEKTG